ncbi:uncharacterized protein C8orf88-like isoform X1 [Electrophorus electricus]|uniref:uncharacterized protein C8orf88-like isoform X1 n=2 Tax=Electrophorus electricus TaxID=8005 RepID=UPI0015D093E4|nr:uncharacterized protein C8orf88-like isoform X1 [Electrophorus electricus]
MDGANIVMGVSRRRIRNLQPARPLRRLNINQEKHREVVAERSDKTTDTPTNTISEKQFYEILKPQSQCQSLAKTERISYSRDLLIRLASSPMAKKKPDFLPDHPVVLEKPRHQDVFLNNFNNNLDIQGAEGGFCLRLLAHSKQ